MMTFMEPTTSQSEDSTPTVGALPVIREHIVSTPDTCGGKPRIAGSRIPVKDVVIWNERQGMAPAEIVSKWPHLTLSDIHAALAYYHDHREGINAEIAADQAWYEEQKAKTPLAPSRENREDQGSGCHGRFVSMLTKTWTRQLPQRSVVGASMWQPPLRFGCSVPVTYCNSARLRSCGGPCSFHP
jgi:uncharacterized protein (DUF433 family)